MDDAGPVPKYQEEIDKEGINYTMIFGELYEKNMHQLRQLNFIEQNAPIRDSQMEERRQKLVKGIKRWMEIKEYIT